MKLAQITIDLHVPQTWLDIDYDQALIALAEMSMLRCIKSMIDKKLGENPATRPVRSYVEFSGE